MWHDNIILNHILQIKTHYHEKDHLHYFSGNRYCKFLHRLSGKNRQYRILRQQAEAAWFEFGEATQKLEYATNATPCSVYAYVQFHYGTQVGVSLDPPSITAGTNIHIEYKLVAGERLNCIDGKKFRDCEDALGSMFNSITGHGDCVPKN